MNVEPDTIAALATPAGTGGVGVVRVSGPGAAGVLARVVRRSAEELEDRRMSYGVARDAAGERLDEVLFVLMRGPRSFTGEDVAEVHGHGGPVNMQRLLRAVLEAGARPAEPGEFSRRAFENGRIDLARAEAILDVIGAASERACRLAQAQLGGAVSERVGRLRDSANALRAEVEAAIDFPEEDLTLPALEEIAKGAAALGAEVAELAATFGVGRALREGVEVAIRGRVNAGKSSMFNALLGSERAIVDPEPGTTRDFVEARVVWDGVPVTLVDTAGEREPGSGVERRGMELGAERAGRADLEVVLHPAPEGVPPETEESPRRLDVVSKGDLLERGGGAGVVTSAKTGEGLEALRAAVLERTVGGAADSGEGLVVTSERQRRLLEEASASLRRAGEAPRLGGALDVLAEELRQATSRLGAILGEEPGDEMLDELFARFCIGK